MSAPEINLPERMNAATFFVDANVEAGRGEKVAIANAADGSTCTYNDVLAMTNRSGNALQALGVRREERVMLLLHDSPEFAFTFFGAIKIGAVPVPVNTLLGPTDYEYLLNDSRAVALVTNQALLDRVTPVLERLPYLRHVVIVGDARAGGHSYSELTASASAELTPDLLSKDDACFWLYSSGTTAFPKGAVHLQHDMIVAADLYARSTLSISEKDRVFSVAKLFFAYGLGNALYFPFRVGASTILYPDKPDAVRAYEIIQEYRPTIFFSVPTGYARMLALDAMEGGYDTASLRLCVSAGEALPAALFERFKARHGVEILDGIGSTEILHIFISNRPGRSRPGSTGEIVPGYEARIVDEQGHDLPPGEVGDLLIKGDSVCACYWNKHEETKDTILGRWIRTGDKYLRDEDGYFWYKGRGDDMLKVGGIWVSPVEVESVLTRHPAVLESAVIGVADADRLIKPKAYVVLRDPAQAQSDTLAAELQQFVKERTAPYKYPRWIEFVPELPKTATGKTQRYKLRELTDRDGG
ncbi:MAG: benzoate-CoA ligase family protein [Phycisphaerae bacterium]